MSAMMVPEGWEVKRLGELVDIVGGGTPARDVEEYWKKGSIPWVTVKDLHHKLEISDSEEKITEFGLKNSAANLIPPKNIITPTRMSLGRFFINSVPITINQDLKALKPKKTIFPLFLLWNLLQYGTKLEALGTGTTVKGITLPDLKNLQLPVPSFPEQQKIAIILSTLDRTIEVTQKLIDKEKMVKKGLMADLLTHGIDEQGRIRSPQTHTYVDSPLGMIPEGWDVKALAQCTEIMNSNIDKKSHPEEQAIRLCNYMDVYSNEEITNAIDFMQATATDSEIKRFLLKKNDVIITKDSESPDDIGIATYVTQDFDDVLCGYHLTLLRPKKNCIGQYLSKALQSDNCVKYFGKVASGSTRYALSIGAIGNTKIIFPPMKEQEKIATILSAQDLKIETEETNLAKLQNLKKGLMGDLLSGKMRVKV